MYIKLSYITALDLVLCEVVVWKNFIAVELFVPCMLSMRSTMKECWTMRRQKNF